MLFWFEQRSKAICSLTLFIFSFKLKHPLLKWTCEMQTVICPLKGDTCILEGSLLVYQVVTWAIEAERTQKAKQWLDMTDSH